MRASFVKLSNQFGFERSTLAYWVIYEDGSVRLAFDNGMWILDGDEGAAFANWVDRVTAKPGGAFVKLSNRFGFNKYKLMRWELADNAGELRFPHGAESIDGVAILNFRRWLADAAQDAPITHAPTIFERGAA